MRNLVVIAADEQRLAGLPDDVAHCAWDVDSGGSYLCTPTGAITFVSPNAQQVRQQPSMQIQDGRHVAL